MISFHYKLTDESTTIEQLLKNKWHIGKKTVHELRMSRGIVDTQEQPIDWKKPLKKGVVIQFRFQNCRSHYIPATRTTAHILFEDEHLLAVYKRPGLAVHPTQPNQKDTLMNEVMAYMQKHEHCYAEHVQRLDKETAGIVLIAKNPIAKVLLDRMIEQKKVERIYLAEVEGKLKRQKATLCYPIGKDRHHPSRRRVSPNGQFAVTHYEIIETKADTTLVQVRLETGRTHQIRVHFSHIGHPIVGDQMYGSQINTNHAYHLLAQKVQLIHPITHQQLTIQLAQKNFSY